MGKDITVKSGSSSVPAYLAEADNPKGGIIVIHEIWGLKDHIKDIANRLADSGYTALAPDLFSDTKIEELLTDDLAKDLFNPEKRNAVQPQLREITAPIYSPEFAESAKAKLKDCFNYLYEMGPLNQKVAVIGFCFGGTYSFQLAVNEPRLKAALPFYGHSDFTLEELKKIKCPILAFYGANDHRLMESLPELKQKLSEAGVQFDAVVYEDAGHAFFNDTNPYAYNEKAAKDAWQKALKFLKENL